MSPEKSARIACDQCDKTYSNRSNHNAHKRTAHPPTPGYVHIPKRRRLLNSQKKSSPPAVKKSNVCPTCGARYAQSASLYRHRKQVHSGAVTTTSNSSSSSKGMKKKSASTSKVGLRRGKPASFLASHSSRPTPRASLETKSNTAARKRLFGKSDEEHVKEEEEEEESANNSNGRSDLYECKDCDLTFTNVQMLMKHISLVHELKKKVEEKDEEKEEEEKEIIHTPLSPTYTPHSPTYTPEDKRVSSGQAQAQKRPGTPYPTELSGGSRKSSLRRNRRKPAKLRQNAASPQPSKRAPLPPPPSTPASAAVRWYCVCTLCDRKYSAVRSLRRHINKAHPEHTLVEVEGSASEDEEGVVAVVTDGAEADDEAEDEEEEKEEEEKMEEFDHL